EDPHDESGPPVPAEATFLLTHPALTGMPREQFEQLALQLESCQQVLTEAERQSAGRDGRGRNPGFGTLDHRHRVLAAVLRSRNTVTLTLAAELMGRKRNVLSYHAGRSKPMLAFAGPELARILVFSRTRPPRTLEALKHMIQQHDNEINSRSS
ncbi:ISAzo13 family transposase, partial [Streptomyces olivoreticuli]